MEKKFKKFISVSVLILFVFGFICSFPVNAGPCEDARDACLLDAFLVGILSGIAAGLVYANMCQLGYLWCQKYYVF